MAERPRGGPGAGAPLMPAVIVIAAWDKFQHYKDRDPPWVKLYRDLLTAESWVLGTDESRLVQVASMLLAARYRNATPLNYSLFRKVASIDLSEAKFRAAIDHLAATGFLEIQGDAQPRKQSASKPQASCTSETEAETDKEAEQIQSARKRAAKRCPEDWQPTDPEVEKIRGECPDIDLLAETRKFRDYEFGRARSDWPATWRNWMREAQSRAGRPNGHKPRPTRYEELMARVEAAPAPKAGEVTQFLLGGKA
jgi:hypothetical protein